MLKAELLADDGILIVHPQAPLAAEDFRSVAAVVDPYIESHGKLHGILIQADKFPGWQDFASFVSHLQFIRDHHKVVAKVAAVSDSSFLSIAPSIASHFVRAEVKHFPASDYAAALNWLKTGVPT
jgi:hypothetical protein